MKFKVNGHEVFASTGGRPFDKKKPLIIFVHGSGLTHMTWVLQTRYFAFHGYNSLAVDLPGHGLSSGESLKSIEETFTSGGLTSIFIFLHSFIKMTILSIFDISLVRFALINSAG